MMKKALGLVIVKKQRPSWWGVEIVASKLLSDEGRPELFSYRAALSKNFPALGAAPPKNVTLSVGVLLYPSVSLDKN